MRWSIWNWVGVFALLMLPLGGCSSSTTDGTGGAAGAGGTTGEGGAGGMAGEGGSTGVGGSAGSGGVEAATSGLWTGGGVGGSAGSLDICFNVNEDGTALTVGSEPGQPCQLWSVEVAFGGDCVNSFTYRPDIPIVDGSFEIVVQGSFELRGSFDGDTASGEASMLVGAPCSGEWQATPSN